MKNVQPFKALNWLETAKILDAPASGVQRLVHAVLPRGWVKDLLHGVPQGHPLHPVLVQLPIGTWSSAVLLDLFPGTGKAAKLLVGTGLASSLPTALAGLADFSELHRQHRRVGLVHAGANILGTAVFAASLVQRARGYDGAGRQLARLGLLLVAAGGSLGGHLAYHQAAGANHAESVPHRVPDGWHRLGELDEFAPGHLVRRMLGDIPLLVWRPDDGTEVFALAGQCSHLAGPLADGAVTGPAGRECVECPWHGSTFQLRTGEVVRGPATAPQPRFRTRTVGSAVEVSPAEAG
ncbi:Rieske 2Fe-2S domain-containing protein [Arthrobacter mobilis]|uniref:Rieske 2Fe-2S domain-containing protein n=1 Tax=Arthrobacter mobilis TaxID=2724944 RepID=A0A7X6HG87_9MICC|nr:Rieske 2Fe-2S domain-containing protein [Arthrobacter mobilis]NKX55815.1 Rieske 2Fe-2S domain-containing protein [Arthrobacter mobilis]